MDINRDCTAMRCSTWMSATLSEKEREREREKGWGEFFVADMKVTFFPEGSTKCRRRQRQTERSSPPVDLCRNPGTVRNCRPHHKHRRQVWIKVRMDSFSQFIFTSALHVAYYSHIHMKFLLRKKITHQEFQELFSQHFLKMLELKGLVTQNFLK